MMEAFSAKQSQQYLASFRNVEFLPTATFGYDIVHASWAFVHQPFLP
jgi:hypothetical protein